MIKDKINEYIDNNKEWLIDRLINLISADTINNPPYGNENNGQVILENIYKELDLKIDRFTPDEVPGFKESEVYLKGRDYSNRDNLVGSIGDGIKKAIIFNGHVDVVPSNIFNWTVTAPFQPKLVNGKMYGLGALDMKGGIIASAFALKSIVDLDIKIKGKVILESVVDEEFGGANGSLACVKKGYTGDFAIIPEPSYMCINVSNISSKVFDIIISGSTKVDYLFKKAGKINAILLMSKLICALKDYENHLNLLKEDYEIYKDIEKPINFLYSSIKAGEIGIDKVVCNPEECRSTIYMINYPDKNEYTFNEELLSFLKRYPEISKNIENKTINLNSKNHRSIEGGYFNLELKENKDFIGNIIENGKKLVNRGLKISAMTAGTDYFAFSNYGNTPVIVLGPGGDNVHAADEYVLLQDLIDLSKIFAGIIYDYCC